MPEKSLRKYLLVIFTAVLTIAALILPVTNTKAYDKGWNQNSSKAVPPKSDPVTAPKSNFTTPSYGNQKGPVSYQPQTSTAIVTTNQVTQSASSPNSQGQRYFTFDGKLIEGTPLDMETIVAANAHLGLTDTAYFYFENQKDTDGKGVFFIPNFKKVETLQDTEGGAWDPILNIILIDIADAKQQVKKVREYYEKTGKKFLNRDIKEVSDIEIFKVIMQDKFRHEKAHQRYGTLKHYDSLPEKLNYIDITRMVCSGDKDKLEAIVGPLREGEKRSFLAVIALSREPKYILKDLFEKTTIGLRDKYGWYGPASVPYKTIRAYHYHGAAAAEVLHELNGELSKSDT